MEKRIFQLSDIPYTQFQQLGIDEMYVKRMFTLEDVERLLVGKSTGLKKNILLKSQSATYRIDAKFLLQKNKPNHIDLIIFSRHQLAVADFGLSEAQMDTLKGGGVVVVNELGTRQKWWIQLDSTINRLFRATENYIKSIPQKALRSDHKYTDADYYDWEYAVHKLENLSDKTTAIKEGEIDLKAIIKQMHSDSHDIANTIFGQ